MKPIPVLISSMIAVLLLAGCVSTRPGAQRRLAAGDRQTLLTELDHSVAAWNRGDLAGHLAIYDASVTKMTAHGPQPGVAAMEAALSRAYFRDGTPEWNLRVEDVALRRLDDGAALMTGRFVLSRQREEKSGWFTVVWVRTASGWKAVHDHTS